MIEAIGKAQGAAHELGVDLIRLASKGPQAATAEAAAMMSAAAASRDPHLTRAILALASPLVELTVRLQDRALKLGLVCQAEAQLVRNCSNTLRDLAEVLAD